MISTLRADQNLSALVFLIHGRQDSIFGRIYKQVPDDER